MENQTTTAEIDTAAGGIKTPAGGACTTLEQAREFFDSLNGSAGSVPCVHAGRTIQATTFPQAMEFFASTGGDVGSNVAAEVNATATDEAAIDTSNDYLVVASRDHLVPIIPIGRMSKPRALRLAAYLVAMADESSGHAEFLKILRAVENT